MAAILLTSTPQTEKEHLDDDNNRPNGGTLILDVTGCPVNIAYAQNVDLLNHAREKLKQTVDEIRKSPFEKKPRMYRQRTRQDYLRLSKSKKRSAKAIRSAIKKQLTAIPPPECRIYYPNLFKMGPN